MSGYRITQAWGLAALALTGLVLALPLAARARASSPGGSAPTASTRPARLNGSSVLLEGAVNPHTLATTYYFKYGPTTAYGHVTAVGRIEASATATRPQKVSEPATGVKEGFHYRLVASNADAPNGVEGLDRVVTSKKKGKSKKSGFVLPKTFAAIPLGSVFVLSGTLTGAKNGGREIVLQATPYPYRTAYVNVGAPLLTSATGAFSFHVANMRTSTRFRIVTVGAPVVTSLIVPEQVEVRVVLKARSSSHKGLYRLYGTVTPAEVGAHVLVQVEKLPREEKSEGAEKPSKLEKPGGGGSGKGRSEKEEKPPTFATRFKTVVKPGTNTLSRFSVVVNISATGHYRVVVLVAAGPLVSGHSTTVLLHAPANAKARKKKNG
jgi:hypothetical protein